MYQGPEHPICQDFAELRFLRLCAQEQRKKLSLLPGGKAVWRRALRGRHSLRRFEGLSGIREFARTFLSVFHAERAEVVPVIQTRANGRSVTEVQLDFVVDGAIEQVPMFVVADLRTGDTLDEVRLYCHCSFVPGLQAYRKPIFRPAHLEMGDPRLLTGAVREYYEALHHVPQADVDRILGSMEKGCKFGGYGPEGEGHQDDHADLRRFTTKWRNTSPAVWGCAMRPSSTTAATVSLNGSTSSPGRQEERSRVAMSGIAAYERGESGKLCAIRISDYAGLERTIDWSRVDVSQEEAKQINLVETFPAWPVTP